MQLAGVLARRSSTSFRARYGSWPLSLADWIRLTMTAARRPARSDPAKSQFERPRAIEGSFCPYRLEVEVH